MRWRNVGLIYRREVRDQLRDRRTLFTVAVLPLLLYPLLGMVFLQMTQFLREHPSRIRVIGAESLPDDPPLLADGRFHPALSTDSAPPLIELSIERSPDDSSATGSAPDKGSGGQVERVVRRVRQDIQAGRYDAALYVPPDFAARLARTRLKLDAARAAPDPAPASAPATDDDSSSDGSQATPSSAPGPVVIANTASDRSRIAARRLEGLLERWRTALVDGDLRRSRIPPSATRPFEIAEQDVAEESSRRAAVWSKVLPFVLLIWALTGAFYPAIDLCAGEKERGTLETLLCSPAQRVEIVWGKLLTTMTFSMTTSMLNLFCITGTGTLFVKQFEQTQGIAGNLQIGAPPVFAIGWLVLALAPLSALFSALSLAIASFARSSREGQYYLMPLMMVCLPLMLLPLLPAAELDLGTSVVPVTGVMLLLRALIEGQYAEALVFLPPVAIVTAVCCWVAVRWAVDQFNNEGVLFRESERWDLRLLLLNSLRYRGETPSFGQAAFAGCLLLLARFFASFLLGGTPNDWSSFVNTTLITQCGLIALPVVAMALLLTRSLTASLLLRRPRAGAVAGAVFLACALHPVGVALASLIRQLYPIGPDLLREIGRLGEIIHQAPNIGLVLLLLAVFPAICEELAFRGFILTGLRHSGRPWLAILISSALFGAVHSILQQSLATFLLGLVIGFLAVRTGSIYPTMVFHAVYNGLALLLSLRGPALLELNPGLSKVLVQTPFGLEYRPAVAAASGLFAALLLAWYQQQPAPVHEDELLRRALDEAPNSD